MAPSMTEEAIIVFSIEFLCFGDSEELIFLPLDAC